MRGSVTVQKSFDKGHTAQHDSPAQSPTHHTGALTSAAPNVCQLRSCSWSNVNFRTDLVRPRGADVLMYCGADHLWIQAWRKIVLSYAQLCATAKGETERLTAAAKLPRLAAAARIC